jgi:predicted transcriptional regulator
MVTANNNLALSPTLQAQIEAAAAKEHRPAGEVLSDAVERYLETQHRTLHTEWELQQARALGLPVDDPPLTPEYRRTIREKIEQGLESVRQGRVVDGEAVFARIEAELVELEHSGRG